MKPFIWSILGMLSLSHVLTAGMISENTYTVPVKEELKPWATFELEDVALKVQKGKRVKLEYTFPKYLIGEENFYVEARGNCSDRNCSTPVTLNGDYGTFVCEIHMETQTAKCRGDYNRKTLPVLKEGGLEPVQQYLKANISDPTELANRQSVLVAFSHEAAGVFENLKVRKK